VDNTKIAFLSQSLSIDTVIFCDLKLKVYLVGNDGEFDILEHMVAAELTELLTKPLI
jgi:hypothetical protein